VARIGDRTEALPRIGDRRATTVVYENYSVQWNFEAYPNN
jgi:hypothetical protein